MAKTSLPTITYNEIINQVINYITTNCQNIANWAGMSNHYKNGTKITISNVTSNHTTKGTTVHSITVASSVVQKTATNVNNDINTFFNNLGLSATARNYPIDDKNLYPFLYNISLFCSYKICWACAHIVSPGNLAGANPGPNSITSGKTSASNRIIVYSNATATGGLKMDPQPSTANDTPIVSNNVVIGSSRKNTLNTTDITNMVNCILNNRLNRKIVSVKHNASIV